MSTLKKLSYAAAMSVIVISSGAFAGAVGTMNVFSAGSPAVADDVNANFTEQNTQINDNHTRISVLENNFQKTLSTSAYMHIPNLAPGAAGITVVELWLSNASTTTCDVYIAKTQQNWKLGDNVVNLGLAPTPTFVARTLGGKTTTASDITTVLVDAGSSLGDISLDAFVGYTVFRKETDVLDTCGPDDVRVHGARVFDPNGQVNSLPLSVMRVK